MNINFLAEFVISAGTLSVCLATLFGLLGRWEWRLDLFSHFRLQYLILLIGFTTLSKYLGNTVVSYIGLAFIFFNFASILPLYLPEDWSKKKSRTSRLFLSNVLRPNEDYEKLSQLIQTTHPDIIVLLEISKEWLEALDSALGKYSYKSIALHYENYGIALFSHYKIDGAQIKYFSEADVPSIIVQVEINFTPLTIIATHPPPPKSKVETFQRNQQLTNIAEFTASQSLPYMLVGDLNLTSWSPYFRKLIHQTGLRDSRKGFGIQPTWPTDKPIFMVPLDHVLVSEQIKVHDRFTSPQIGSDHLPVIVDFSLDERADKVENVV